MSKSLELSFSYNRLEDTHDMYDLPLTKHIISMLLYTRIHVLCVVLYTLYSYKMCIPFVLMCYLLATHNNTLSIDSKMLGTLKNYENMFPLNDNRLILENKKPTVGKIQFFNHNLHFCCCRI